jgi:dTDP-4-dehydrorhamnose reductase
MIKIAITGSTGLVGSRIIELLENDIQFLPIKQEEGIDITNKDNLWQKIKNLDFDYFLHLAAYTNVDAAEQEKTLAHKINVDGTRNVWEITNAKSKKLIYISTGFVFDGQHPPYDESSQPQPVSYYGQTKLEGEKIVKNNSMIIRFDYPYRKDFAPKKDFVRAIRSLLEQKKSLKMITDSTITPTFIDDIAFGIKHLIYQYSPETFHLVGANSLSPFEAGKLIAKTYGYDENLVQLTTYEEYFVGKAKRPQYATIISKKNQFYPMKTFEEGLKQI